MSNYYDILGVSKEANSDEIKKAYRKLAIQHHPDKGGDENKFKEIAKAYETLSDSEKRKNYDMFGEQGRNMGGGFGNVDINEMMKNFFNGGSNPFDQRREQRAPDKVIDVQLSILESYSGVKKVFNYSKKIHCDLCGGTGGDRNICSDCNGHGFQTRMMGSDFFSQMIRTQCNGCGGTGSKIKNACGKCHGHGFLHTMESLTLDLPKGLDDGNFLRIAQKGDFYQGLYGDLVLRVKLINDETLEKIGNDLIYNVYMDYINLLDDSVEVNHPDGKLSVKIPNEFNTTKPLRIRGKGFLGQGDFYIKIHVKFNRDELKNRD